jgi:hypothetical protein
MIEGNGACRDSTDMRVLRTRREEGSGMRNGRTGKRAWHGTGTEREMNASNIGEELPGAGEWFTLTCVLMLRYN